MHLLEEFFQVSPTFMIYPGIRKKTTSVPILKDTDTEINILPKTHLWKTSQSLVHCPANSHIKTTGIEFVHLLFSATDTSGREERGHGIVNCLLNISERIVCTVGATKSIGRRSGELLLYRIEVAFGKDDIRIQYNKVFAFATFCSVITGLSRTGIGFREIFYIQPICIPVYYSFTGNGRTIFNNNNLKTLKVLYSKTLQ